MAEKNAVLLIIDWGGVSPSRTWYRWLDALMPGGEVIQEGVYLFTSSSAASTVAILAARGFETQDGIIRPVSVSLWNASPIGLQDDGRPSELADNAAAILGKRGRRSSPSPHVVTCYDEVESFDMLTSGPPPTCPGCGGTNIVTRKGERAPLRVDPAVSVLDSWASLRFTHGNFEIPITDDAGIVPTYVDPATTYLDLDAAREAIETAQTRECASRECAYGILDGLYASRYRYE